MLLVLYTADMLDREHFENGYSENGYSESGEFESRRPSGNGHGPRRRSAAGTPRWHLCVDEDGQLTAVLAGSDPPVTVSGASIASLRRQIRNAMLRGLI
jgi:hypothetical protein